MEEGLHIAFTAARALEHTSELGLGDYNVYIDPLVDENGLPHVLVRVDGEGFDDVAANMPDHVVVLKQSVPITVQHLVARMH